VKFKTIEELKAWLDILTAFGIDGLY